MDQYVVALGQRGKALLIDCRALEFEPVLLELGSACVLICDTQVRHELSSSAYNERRRQCEAGVALLAANLPGVRALRDVSQSDLEKLAPRLPELIARRCRHVVSENARTLTAARHLKSGELVGLGELMSASHASLRDDYEVSCPELDEAVTAASLEPGDVRLANDRRWLRRLHRHRARAQRFGPGNERDPRAAAFPLCDCAAVFRHTSLRRSARRMNVADTEARL